MSVLEALFTMPSPHAEPAACADEEEVCLKALPFCRRNWSYRRALEA